MCNAQKMFCFNQNPCCKRVFVSLYADDMFKHEDWHNRDTWRQNYIKAAAAEAFQTVQNHKELLALLIHTDVIGMDARKPSTTMRRTATALAARHLHRHLTNSVSWRQIPSSYD